MLAKKPLLHKSDLRRNGNDYLSKNAEQEVSVKLGLDYQKDDTTTSINYERIQSTNNKAHMSIPRAIASSVAVSLLVSTSFAFILIRLMS
jgi:endo-beta-N-acetylglucosaminidase D